MEARLKEPLWALIGSAAIFAAVMLLAYLVWPAGRIDAIALSGLMALDGQITAPAANFLAGLGNPAALLAMLAAVVVLGLYWGRPRQTLAAVGIVVGANVMTQVLKVVLAHPRVQPALGAGTLGPVAFPSGHTTAAMSIAVALALVTPRELRPIAVVAGAGLALAVGTSVMVLGWHYPSDVVGGALIATGWGFAALAALAIAERRRPSPAAPSRRRPQPGAWRRIAPGAAWAVSAAAGVVALSRAGELVTYARAHTIAAAVALAVAACVVTLLATLMALARE